MSIPLPPAPPPPKSRSKKWRLPLILAGIVITCLVVGLVSISANDDTTTDPFANQSSAPPPVESTDATFIMPDLVGLTVDTATLRLEKALNESVLYEDKDLTVNLSFAEFATGHITSTDPAAGEPVTGEIEATVTLPPMPNVVGEDIAQELSVFKSLGYRVIVKKEISTTQEGTILKQTPAKGSKPVPGDDAIKLTVAKKQPITVSQQNAIQTALDYLDYTAFSESGLIDQLEFEKFSTADATFAVEHIRVNWNEQAAKSAKDYLKYSSFSRQGLIDQLVFEGFTLAQATYGVNQTGL